MPKKLSHWEKRPGPRFSLLVCLLGISLVRLVGGGSALAASREESCHQYSSLISAFSAPLHPIPTADFLAIKFALDERCDPQFSRVPETLHLTGEVFGELG